MTKTTARDAHVAISEFLDQAKQSEDGATDFKLAERLLPHLAGSKFLRKSSIATERDNRGHIVVQFWPDAPKPISIAREMKVIHAAITLVLEMAGADIAYEGNDDKGRDRFKLWVELGPVSTLLPHILFGTPTRGRLYEKLDRYHAIVPDSFRFKRSPNRSDVIEAVRRNDAALAPLLADLFKLADRWHGTELEIVGEDQPGDAD